MGWALAAGGTTGVTGNGVTSLSLNAPTGISANDLLILSVFGYTNGTITLPSGFTAIQNGASTASAYATGALAWKLATASEPASYTVDFSVSSAVRGNVVRFIGGTTTPYDNSSAYLGPASTAPLPLSVTPTAFNTAAAEDLLVWFGYGISTGSVPSMSVPSGFSSIDSGYEPSGSCAGGLAYAVQASAGTTGTPSGTLSASSGNGTYVADLAAFLVGSSGPTSKANQMFFGDSGVPGKLSPRALAVLAPLAWMVERRNRLRS